MRMIRNIVFVSIPSVVVLLLLLELVFRFVIPATDPPMGYFNEEERMFYLSNKQKEGIYTIGRFAQIRARWHVNNDNWNYPIDYYPVGDRKLIAVVGDSYIEALQVDVDKNYPFLLREKLYPEYDVYAFGKSGASLSHYLHISRYVNRHYDPDILVFNIGHNDFDESIYELYPNRPCFMQLSVDDDGSFTETVPRPHYAYPQYKTWKRLVYKSALFRYLDLNLKIRQIRRNIAGIDENKFEANISPDKVRENQERIFEATDHLVRTIREENIGKRIIFVFDAPRGSIYDGTLHESRVSWMYDMMDKICSMHNVEYIDLTPLMEKDYRENMKKFNSELDGHWDEYGHRFVADVLLDYLEGAR